VSSVCGHLCNNYIGIGDGLHQQMDLARKNIIIIIVVNIIIITITSLFVCIVCINMHFLQCLPLIYLWLYVVLLHNVVT
jgi:hypothetical protein